jgi:hypothetical protein
MKTLQLLSTVFPYLLGLITSFGGAMLLFVRTMGTGFDRTHSPSRSARHRRAF